MGGTAVAKDEFVWIDSSNRLVELQQLPWNQTDITKVVNGKSGERTFHGDAVARLSYYLQRLLVRVAREAQRLSRNFGKCGEREISASLKIILSPSLATSAVRYVIYLQ